VYLYSEEGRRAVLAEHAEMIGALRDGDNTRLAALMQEHREGGSAAIAVRLS